MIKLLSAVLTGLIAFSAEAAHTQARLALEADTARAGETVLAGVQLRMDARWHTYWRNPGASGMATKIEWQLPPGVTAGQTQWPVPEKLPDEDLTTYIYKDNVVLLVPLKLAPDVRPGPIELKAKVSWLECEVQCVPGEATVQATLNTGAERKGSKDAGLIEAWQHKLPRGGEGLNARAWWEKAATADLRPLMVEWASTNSASDVDFYPDGSEHFEVQGPTERIPAEPGKLSLRKQVKKFSGDWPQQVSGLVVERTGKETLAYDVNLPTKPSVEARASSGTGILTPSFWRMLLYAFLGGLILNVMPCVLPVIALKILGFVNQAKEDPGRVRKLGIIYTLGVLVSFLVLAAVIIGVRAVGNSVGWGFQFGNPYFLIVMTTLVALITLNLFGVFEVTLSGRAMSAASSASSKHGVAGAFFNGLLATVLATSCSAPVLGAAVGFAFARDSSIIVVFMLTVGLGLAAPYLVLSWHPAWLRFLPRPGAWMERFKIAMGFPMLAAAVWLCSLLSIHYGERAWWMAVFMVFLAVAAWVYGEFVQRGTKRRRLATLLSVVMLVIGYAYAVDGGLRWREPLKETTGEALPKEAPRGIAWGKWSSEAVAEARAAGRPVLVDFTAKWCPTCNTIVKPTLENSSVQKKLKDLAVVPLLANYTLQPASITAELRRFDRAGVPLVLIYPRNPAAPPMVFDLITPATVIKALDQAAM